MYIVSPLSRCASAEKRDVFFDHIARIAPVAYEDEPGCVGYAWFRSTKENDTIPLHWCRGFEVYTSPEASRVAHRASEQYKAFRHAVSTEGLLEAPSDLEFWHSTDIGFLTKGGCAKFPNTREHEALQYIVTDELAVPGAGVEALFDQLRNVADAADREPDILTCWVLDRPLDETSSKTIEKNVYILLRFRTRAAYNVYRDTISRAEWKTIDQLATHKRTTTWEEAGIGFLGK